MQILGIGFLSIEVSLGKSISAFVIRSLRLRSLLYPKIGGLGNRFPQSALFETMF